MFTYFHFKNITLKVLIASLNVFNVELIVKEANRILNAMIEQTFITGKPSREV